MPKRKTNEQFLSELNDSNIEILDEYRTSKTKLRVRYKNCGHIDTKTPSKLLAGQRCSICRGRTISKAKTKNTKQYKEDLANNGIDYIELLGEYKASKKKIKVLNLKCNHIYEAQPENILHGSGCPVCYGYKNTESFIDIINRKYPNEYEIYGEYVNSLTPIKVKHKCGYIWNVRPKYLLQDFRCPKCNMSRGERYIEEYLIKNGIKYKRQFVFDDCRDKNPLPFDFMIDINGEIRLIEFDGSQHFEKTMFYSEKIAIHDKMKDDYCKEHCIKLLRIPYWWLRNKRIDKELDSFIV